MNKLIHYSVIVFYLLLLTACSQTRNYAPVTDLSQVEGLSKNGLHKVTQGETLYAIAWRYGLDYRDLAERNHIAPPYTIFSGQRLSLRQGKSVANQTKIVKQTQLIASSKPVIKVREEKEPNYSSSGWVWPTQGRIIHAFSAMNKGVNIAGRPLQPIYAAASGKVVYCGNGLRSYGNLIIIKHNSLYLSAYAHSARVLVKDGDWVKKGQKISEMGDTGTNKVMLHFEIRRAGKPINPLSLY